MRWTDFDPVVSTVLIERTADNSGRVKTTKTAETRLVDVSARLAAALTDPQASLEAEAMDGRARGHLALGLSDESRDACPAESRRQNLRAGAQGSRPPHFRLYDLRHTYASHLIAAGAPIDYVAKQLGHSKLTTTLLYYAHWFPKPTVVTSMRWSG
jgi:integrase